MAIAQPAAAAPPRPKLIVAVSVDQFSADLFNEYRTQFSGGLKRLQEGVIFPAGYHAHAATETCPGHATLLTGDYPTHTGIIANNWMDMRAARADKRIYCAEDETAPGSTSKTYLVSPVHLRVPTLGDRMKAANPQARIWSVSGKDRAAIMMGGHSADGIWWWNGKTFTSFAGRETPEIVSTVNARTSALISTGLPSPFLPPPCKGRVQPIAITAERTVGITPPPLAAGDADHFNIRAELDQATLDIAAGIVDSQKLGRGPATDLIAVGLSVTDYVGHSFGTEGPEMCNQLLALDQALGRFLDRLDRSGVAYAVMLSADHGGHDIPERNRSRAITDDQRIDAGLSISALNAALGHADKPALTGDISGDLYLTEAVAASDRDKLLSEAKTWLQARPQVAAVFSDDELQGAARPTSPPELWTLRERAAASFAKGRSGDLVVLLKPRVIPIGDVSKGYITTHGSAWDYDRRVPILFWWHGVQGFEQPNSVRTVDIMPTLAGLIGLALRPGEIDGQCLDLDSGVASTCVSN
jgi:predicted AlkP superfamily pyrophosphatase or phosphodiesterase